MSGTPGDARTKERRPDRSKTYLFLELGVIIMWLASVVELRLRSGIWNWGPLYIPIIALVGVFLYGRARRKNRA